MPRLKRTYENLDAVEEIYRPFYEEKDGKAVLAVEIEGLVPASKIEEFRQTNIKDREKFETELEKFKDVDVEEYKELKGRAQDLSDHKLIKRGELETVLKPRIEEATKPLRDEIAKERNEKEQWKNRYAASTVESKVIETALPFGLKKGAAIDLVRRARDVFRVNDDGEIQAFEPNGTTPKFHLGDPYTIEQFIKETRQAEDGKHLFEANSGGGGDPTARGGMTGEPAINPWNPETLNRTTQGEIMRKNRPMAIRMAAKFGVVIPPLPPGAAAA